MVCSASLDDRGRVTSGRVTASLTVECLDSSDQTVGTQETLGVKVFQTSVFPGNKSHYSGGTFFGSKSKGRFWAGSLEGWNLNSEMSGENISGRNVLDLGERKRHLKEKVPQFWSSVFSVPELSSLEKGGSVGPSIAWQGVPSRCLREVSPQSVDQRS